MTDRDRRDAELLVEHGFAAREPVEECLHELAELKARGQNLRLCELLRTRGYLVAEVPDEVLKALEQPENDIGRFVLVALVGRGGTGEVYRAWEKGLGRYVAVKFIRAGDSDDLARFMREAQIAAGLNHPNIAPVYELSSHNGRPFIIMRYIHGTTIDRADLDLRGLIRALRDASRALHFAHQQGIVHRDIKPGNIMLEEDRAYVTDFGLARPTQVDSSISQSGIILGTPQYMSPEQACGQTKLVDARSDVYSLGATLYALVAGRPPFDLRPDEDVMALLRRVTDETPLRPSRLRPDLPRELETIILKAMEKERDRRYQSAMELAEDLQRYLDGEPVLARRPTLAYRLAKRISKHRWLAAALLLATVLAIGFGAYVAGARVSRERQKAQWVQEGDRSAQAGRWQEALGAYERAHALDPEDAALAEKRSAAAGRLRQIARKLEDEKQAIQIYKDSERDLTLLRLRTYRPNWRLTEAECGEYERVIERCLQQMRTSGECGDGWWIVARAREMLGDRGGAIEAYSAGLRAQPDHAGCLLYYARLLTHRAILERFARAEFGRRRAEQMMKQAREMIERAIAGGTVSEIELDLACGYERVIRGQPTGEYTERMLKRWEGRDFFEEFHLIRGLGDWNHLSEAASAAIATRPGFWEAYLYRGAAQQTLGRFDKAMEDYTRALEIHPRFADGYNHRGLIHQHYGNPAAALADYTRAIQYNPSDAWGYVNRSSVYHSLRDLPAAVKDCTAAIARDPFLPEAYANRGAVHLDLKDYAAAASDYTRALELEPAYSPAYFGRGDARMALQEWDHAIEDYTSGLRLSPGYVHAHVNRGLAREMKGDTAGALEDYDRALSVDPRQPEAYMRRGVLRLTLRQHDGALQDITRAIQLDPDVSRYHIIRGLIHLSRGEINAARLDFESAIKRDPKDPDAWMNHGRIMESLSKLNPAREAEYLQTARTDFETALAVSDTSWPHRGETEAALKRIQARLAQLRARDR